MKVFMFITIGIALSFILRRCLKPMYSDGCNIICQSQGREAGVMINNWHCVCHGYKLKKDNTIRKP
jgi:hypothetical protein